MLGFVSLSETPLGQVVTLAEATIILGGAPGTFTLGTLGFEALANHTISTSATASMFLDAVEGQGAGNGSATGVTSAFTTGSITSTGLANITPTGAISTFSLDIDFDAKANIDIDGAISSFDINSVDFDAQASITTSDVTASFSTPNISYALVARTRVEGVFGVFETNLPTPTAVRFPYQDFADQYDRGRTIYLLAYDDAKVAHVNPVSYTVVLRPEDENRTVHITPQNNTVYIRAESEKNTVYIRR